MMAWWFEGKVESDQDVKQTVATRAPVPPTILFSLKAVVPRRSGDDNTALQTVKIAQGRKVDKTRTAPLSPVKKIKN